MPERRSLADLVGPWQEPAWESGLVARCRAAWNRPLEELTRAELAMLLRQRIALEHLLPLAQRRLAEGVRNDDSEFVEDELATAVARTSRAGA